MQNNYIKELAIKSYQEEITREYINSRKRTFHYPSFVSGLIAAVFLVGFL